MGFVTLDDAQAARLNQERGREPLSFSDYEATRYFRLPRPRGGMYRDAFDSYEYFDAAALFHWVESQRARNETATNPKTSQRITKKDLDELLHEEGDRERERERLEKQRALEQERKRLEREREQLLERLREAQERERLASDARMAIERALRDEWRRQSGWIDGVPPPEPSP